MKEIWKYISKYKGLYKISNLGRVKSYKWSEKGKILAMLLNKHGYYEYRLSRDGVIKNEKAHRLVAEAFIPNPYNLPCINHKDGNKQNNSVNNLEWCTYSHNTKEAYRLGLIPKSEKQIKKLIENNIKRTKKVIQKDLTGNNIKTYNSSKEASLETGINIGNIRACCRYERNKAGGYKWQYVEQENLYE